MSGYKSKQINEVKMPVILAGAAIAALILFCVIIFSGNGDDEEKDERMASAESRLKEMENKYYQLRDEIETQQEKLDELENSIPMITKQIETQLDEFQKKMAELKTKPVSVKKTAAVQRKTTVKKLPVKTSVKAKTVVQSGKTKPKSYPKFHIVQDEDNLYQISLRYGLSVDELKRMNNLASNEIKLGQRLKVSRE